MPMSPASLPTEETLAFLEHALPHAAAPAGKLRVLEVGCGAGAVARALLDLGVQVTALDASAEAARAARRNGVAAVEADFLRFDGGPFDVVLFSRSLHHIAPLDAALARAHGLLERGGLLLAEEFAVEAIDRRTARWLYAMQALLERAGLVAPAAAPAARDPLARWHAEHGAGDHAPTPGLAMLEEIGSRFEPIEAVEGPYLYRYVCDRLEPTERGYGVARQVLEWEVSEISDSSLCATGLRIVASRR